MTRVRGEEWAKFWLRDGVAHLYAHYVTHAFSPHTHEGYVIAAVEGGVQAFRCRGARHHATRGQVIFINPEEVHTGNAATEQGWRYRPLYPSVGKLQGVVRDVFGAAGVTPYFAQTTVYDPELAAQVRRYHLLSERGSALAVEAAFLEMARLALERYADLSLSPRKVGREPAAVRAARAYLEANTRASVSLSELEKLTGLSPYALLRAFRRQTGLTPREYQLVRRVEEAKRRLLEGEPVASVAVEAGFHDQSHLGRHFKRVVGVTPKAFSRGAISS